MTNLTQPGFFRQVFDVYLDLGLSYHQAALVNYIHRWNATGQECFAAVETIAADLRLTLRTMRRVIDRSIAEGIIAGSSGRGRARVLKVTDTFLKRVKSQLETQVSKVDTLSVHSVTVSGQSGHLSRSISRSIPRSTYPNLPSTKLDLVSNKLDLGSKSNDLELDQLDQSSYKADQYTMYWDEEKNAMVRRRCR
jgi:DNA-binding MarR family transcriptional regulator